MFGRTRQRAMRADGTILDIFPVGKVLTVIGLLLIALFTLIKPEASNGLGILGRLLFWSSHVGLGLVGLWIAGRWLAHGRYLPNSVLIAVLSTGIAAILIAAPGYLLLDSFFAPYTIDLDPDPPMPWATQAVQELAELAPWFMLTWLIINLPVFFSASSADIRIDDTESPIPESISVTEHESDAEKTSDVSEPRRHATRKLNTGEELRSIDNEVTESLIETAQKQQYLSSLPGIVGTDIIAVSSDLHYLNVWTVEGRSTVLGNLRGVVDDLGEFGMQVHRSHWVAHAHVQRIVGNASKASCILTNELRIPISRRRWKSVREYYGRGVVHLEASLSDK